MPPRQPANSIFPIPPPQELEAHLSQYGYCAPPFAPSPEDPTQLIPGSAPGSPFAGGMGHAAAAAAQVEQADALSPRLQDASMSRKYGGAAAATGGAQLAYSDRPAAKSTIKPKSAPGGQRSAGAARIRILCRL